MDDSGIPERNWPAVDYQTAALLTSGFDKKGTKKKGAPRRFAVVKKTSAAQDKANLLATALLVECRAVFVRCAQNREYLSADADVVGGALYEICRSRGVHAVPSKMVVQRWVEDNIPGDKVGQIISFEEFLLVLQALCPALFPPPRNPLPPVNIPIETSADSNIAFGMAHRKFNATALHDYSDGGSREDPGNAHRGGAVFVSNGAILAAAVKQDERRSRKFARDAGVPMAPMHTRVLEKQRILQATRAGPDPSRVVRLERAAREQRKARREYSSSLAGTLGCGLTAVRRSLASGDHAKQREMEKRAVAGVVEGRRREAQAVRLQTDSLRKNEAEQLKAQRKAMMATLDKGVKEKQRAKAAETESIRSGRERLHWREHSSGIIPHDEEVADRKAGATTYSEWKTAVDEGAMRESMIREERLRALAADRQKQLSLSREALSTASVHVDGSDVFMKAYTTKSNDEAFGFMTSPQPPRVSATESFQVIDDDDGEEISPPMNMIAAARAFGITTPAQPPGFGSVAPKGPTEAFYSSSVALR